MILRDEIEILLTRAVLPNGATMRDDQVHARETVPAHVSYRSAKDEADDGRSYYQVQHLTAMIDPLDDDLNPTHHNVEWRGRRYALDGVPLIRRQGTEDHHWTIALIGSTG